MTPQELDDNVAELSKAIAASVHESESVKAILGKIRDQSGLNAIFEIGMALVEDDELDDDDFEDDDDDEEPGDIKPEPREKITTEITADDIDFLSKLKITLD